VCGSGAANHFEPLHARARASTFRCLNPRRLAGRCRIAPAHGAKIQFNQRT
jgi:hypothetical protein